MHAEIATGHNVQFLAICVFPVAISSVVSFRMASISYIAALLHAPECRTGITVSANQQN